MARNYTYSNLELARKAGLKAASSQKPSNFEREIIRFFESNGLRNYKKDPEFFPLTFEVHTTVPILSKFYNVDFVIPSHISPLIVIEVKEIKSRLYETHSPKAHMLNSRFANFRLQYPKINALLL